MRLSSTLVGFRLPRNPSVLPVGFLVLRLFPTFEVSSIFISDPSKRYSVSIKFSSQTCQRHFVIRLFYPTFRRFFVSLFAHSFFLHRHFRVDARPRIRFTLLSLPFLPRKEVIQPHLPIRLPCYDFTPVIGLTFDGCFLR